MSSIKKYLSFFRIRFVNGLQYRAAAYAGIATQFAWGFMEILMYSAFLKSNISASPMAIGQLNSYIWMRQAFLCLFMSWFYDNEIFDMITSGNVAYEMCRPADIYTMWFAKNSASRVSKAALRCAPILLVAFFLPPSIKMNLPVSLLAFIIFLLSMVLGLLLTVSFSMLIYLTAFYTISPIGIRIIATNIIALLSGELIPLPFFPESLSKILELLPFAAMQSTPFLIYNGVYSNRQAVFAIILQLTWFIVITLTGKLLMNKTMKRIIVQGG